MGAPQDGVIDEPSEMPPKFRAVSLVRAITLDPDHLGPIAPEHVV